MRVITDEENAIEIDSHVLFHLEEAYYWMAHLPERYGSAYKIIQTTIDQIKKGEGIE